jgi:hypothetical protein
VDPLSRSRISPTSITKHGDPPSAVMVPPKLFRRGFDTLLFASKSARTMSPMISASVVVQFHSFVSTDVSPNVLRLVQMTVRRARCAAFYLAVHNMQKYDHRN